MAIQLNELASEAYVFGFPLVFDLEQVERFTTAGLGSLQPAAFNTFSHARTLAGPQDTFVSINNDTAYSIAQIDLSVGPIRLSVPDAGERYYVLQFVDAWTNNFAYVGTRATGQLAGEYLLVPPGWDDSSARADGADEGVTVIRFPTRVGTIVGRWAVDGEGDLPAVHALQDALSLTAVHPTLAPPEGIPDVAAGLSEALDFFEKLRVWSQEFPPAERDRAALDSYAELGVTGPDSLADASGELVAALEQGYAAGKEALEAAIRSGAQTPQVNGWMITQHMFDYNLDFFEVGAVDDPEWKSEDPKTRYAQRAGAARGGLWGNHGYEASYPMTYTDAAGEALTGDHVYTLRLHPTPPVHAFWSLTMYDLPHFYLVANELNRYSVGDRTPGIVYDDDGGLTITISSAKPTDAKAGANWLPAPGGPFRPLLRMYAPAAAALDGTYALPAIERVG
jgi:hypothetical protein